MNVLTEPLPSNGLFRGYSLQPLPNNGHIRHSIILVFAFGAEENHEKPQSEWAWLVPQLTLEPVSQKFYRLDNLLVNF
jgi:hypothetical protein